MKTLLLLALGASGHAQSTISPTDRYAYAANAGWIDFRVSAPDGVRVSDTCLAGLAYGANFGFIDLGNGVRIGAGQPVVIMAGPCSVDLKERLKHSKITIIEDLSVVSAPLHRLFRVDEIMID